MLVYCYECLMQLAYRSEFDIIAQRHSNSVSFLHASLLQASSKGIGGSVERFIREDSALVV
jgi:hypothetical protein